MAPAEKDKASDQPSASRRRRVERRHHKAEKLPREVRDELAKRFQAGETYDQLVAWLKERGFEIGRSSVHRWGARFQKHLEKLRAWREAAQTIVADLSGKPATELNEAAEQSAVQLLFELVIDLQSAGAGETDDAVPDLKGRSQILATAAHALANLGHSAAGRERLKIAFKKEFAEDAAKKIADAVGDAKVGGRSVVETVREALGIA